MNFEEFLTEGSGYTTTLHVHPIHGASKVADALKKHDKDASKGRSSFTQSGKKEKNGTNELAYTDLHRSGTSTITHKHTGKGGGSLHIHTTGAKVAHDILVSHLTKHLVK